MTTNLKIEHYILGKTIGEGASSKVKIAQHEFLNTNVAIKIINKKRMKRSNMGVKIKREIRLLRYFSHPNIIRLYEVLETQNDIYVVMEHISGGELFELVFRRGKLCEAQARCFFQQIISGVEYCHLNLVAHRDLKPENILIDSNNMIKIADFGLSNLMKDGKFLKTSCGSPNYAAPEIINGKKYSGVEIDTWSCGVILYTLVSGFLPFDEELLPAMFKKIREADYYLPSHVTGKVADLIVRMLQADPMNRIKFEMIKKHPWLSDATPLYLQMSLENARSWFASKIDEEILRKIAEMEFNFQNFREEQIRESIVKRKDYSFVIGYDLLLNEKIKTQISATKSHQREEEHRRFESRLQETSVYHACVRAIEQDVEFVLWNYERVREIEQNSQMGDWQYGLIFKAPPRLIMQVLTDVLGELNTTFVVKSADYKIKCFHRVQKRIYEGSGSVIYDASYSELNYLNGHLLGKNAVEDKFSLSELNFNIQLYQMSDSLDHLVDIQRTKGQCLVFLDYCQSLVNLLTTSMQKYLNQVQAQINNNNLFLEHNLLFQNAGKFALKGK